MPSMNNWFRMSSEASPLLPARNPSDYLNTFPIFPLVEALEATNFIHLRWQDLIPRTVSVSFDTEPCKSLAFALIVLLELRKRQIAWKGQYPTNSYGQWTEEEARARDVEILEDKMSEFWETFLTQYRSSSDLHDVLWTPFLLKKDKSRTIRGVKFFFPSATLSIIHSTYLIVADFLVDRDGPSKFIAHPIVSMTMSRMWKYGRPEGSHLPTMFRNILNTRATPW